jgi:riboflavin synthase
MNGKFYLKALPKMETELNLIKAMIDVAIYENNIAEHPNKEIVKIAENIFREKVLELEKVLKNPSKFDKTPTDDLIE